MSSSRLFAATAMVILILCLTLCIQSNAQEAGFHRGITVRDIIEMGSLGEERYFNNVDIGLFSPDEKQFALVTRHGDLEAMVDAFALLIYRTSDLLQEGAKPFLIRIFKSSSNDGAIRKPTWSRDGRALFFIAESPSKAAQVMRLDIASGDISILTHSKTSVVAFSRTAHSSRIAFVAQADWRTFWNEKTERNGLMIRNQRVPDLMTGRAGYRFRGLPDEFDLFVEDRNGVRRIPLKHHVARPATPSLSPDGRYLLVSVNLHQDEISADWQASKIPWVQSNLRFDSQQLDDDSIIPIIELVDLKTGESRPLLDVPASPWAVIGPPPVWIRNDAVVLRSYLPNTFLSTPATGEASLPPALEVEIATGRTTPIGQECADPIAWDSQAQILECQSETQLASIQARLEGQQNPNKRLQLPEDRFFARGENGWVRVQLATETLRSPHPRVFIREDYKTAPKIFVSDPVTHKEHVLLDFNPALKNAKIGRIDNLTWDGPDGQALHAGLFYPPDFESGHTYPLVIQTHGWLPYRYQLAGFSASGYVAEPLAARGFMVLQLDDVPIMNFLQGQHKKEIDTVLAIYRSALDRLDRLGLIDRNHIGIIGWSHTCFYVKYALAHTDLFAAATVAEGEDGGYLQYITGENSFVDPYSMYGGPPYGNTLLTWFKESPGFNLTHVKAPLRIAVLNPHFLLAEWEWFRGLRELHKPVEMVMFRDGAHTVVKPYERLQIGEANVDWFDFWLNGREDSDPAKAAQYARWRKLRKLQESNRVASGH